MLPVIIGIIVIVVALSVAGYFVFSGDDDNVVDDTAEREAAADMDGDGDLDEDDVTALGMYVASPQNNPVQGDPDVNCDNDVNSGDVRYLGKYLDGDEDYTPLYPGCFE